MIGYVNGTVTWLGDTACIIDVRGMGYRVYIGKNTRLALTLGISITLFTHLSVKEHDLELVGFATENEYALFMILIQASGVGAKLAVVLLDTLGVAGAARAIAQKDAAMLSRVPGIGKKTAEKICVELSDKIPDIFIGTAKQSPLVYDIIDALVTMGYSEYHAQKVVHQLQDISSLESGIAQALQVLGK